MMYMSCLLRELKAEYALVRMRCYCSYDVTKGVIVNMIVCLRGPGWQHHCLYLRASVVWACRRLCSSEGVGKQPPRGKEFTTSTSSLRVDAVAAAGLDIARKYA